MKRKYPSPHFPQVAAVLSRAVPSAWVHPAAAAWGEPGGQQKPPTGTPPALHWVQISADPTVSHLSAWQVTAMVLTANRGISRKAVVWTGLCAAGGGASAASSLRLPLRGLPQGGARWPGRTRGALSCARRDGAAREMGGRRMKETACSTVTSGIGSSRWSKGTSPKPKSSL